MRTLTFNIYKIDEHPNPSAVYDCIRENWHDLGEFELQDMVKSLEALAAYIGGDLDYSLSIVPDRGEYVRITDYNAESLAELYEKRADCPLTGMCYDCDVIEALHNGNLESTVLKTLHNAGEYLYSDEGLHELCELNEYEFYENGKLA